MRANISFNLVSLSLSASVLADGAADFHALQYVVLDAAKQIYMRANATTMSNGTALPTTSTPQLLGNIIGTIVYSKTSLDGDQNAFVNGSAIPMDDSYLLYVNQIPTLASAVTAQGRAWHTQMNAPVYASLQQLATAIHAMGSDLARRDLISTDALIRTIRAGSAIVDAENAWHNNWNMPGRKRSFIA